MEQNHQFIVILATASSEKEADRIAKALVQEGLAPCVNVVPEIVSTYYWKEAVQTGKESLMVIKTRADQFDRVKARIEALHSYDVPEIICLAIVEGSEKYLAWMEGFFK